MEQAVAIAVQSVTEKLGNGEMKPSVADFVRLLELQQQMVADDIRDLKVSWDDSLNETESITDE